MSEPNNAEPSVDQVEGAFRDFFKIPPPQGEPAPAPVAQPAPEPAKEEPPAEAASTDATPEAQEEKPAEAPETEDVASLRQKMQQLEQERDRYANQARNGLDWARNLALKKSSETERYKSVIKRLKDGEQMSPEDLDRLLGQTEPIPPAWQPANPLAVAMQPVAPQDEMVALETQQFLMDQRLDEKTAADFHKFLLDPASPISARSLVQGNTYATLKLTYDDYKAAKAQEATQTAAAVKTIAKAQREGAKAAATMAARSSPTPTPPPARKFEDLTADEMRNSGAVDRALKELAGQYQR